MNNYKIWIVLGDINAKIGREHTFKPTIGLHSLHEITNDNGMKLINLATSKGFTIISTVFPHKDIYKCTWKSLDRCQPNWPHPRE